MSETYTGPIRQTTERRGWAIAWALPATVRQLRAELDQLEAHARACERALRDADLPVPRRERVS